MRAAPVLAIAAVALLPATAAAAGPISFSTPSNHAVGITPYSVVTSDLDGDDALDLVVPNRNSNTVSVLLGDGAGGFADAVDFPTGTAPAQIATADFNGDSNRDLAVTNFESNDVSVLLGDGTGDFGTAVSFTVGEGALAIASDDFNGDTHADLAVTNYFTNDVSILLGDGAGAFGPATDVPVGAVPQSVVAGTFNDDGVVDLAVANSGDGDVSVLLGDGIGGFVAAGDHPVGATPMSVATGEFDEDPDGGIDLAVANFDSNSVSVLAGDGQGGFGTATSLATGTFPPAVAVADLDGDSHDDITVPNSGGANVSVLLGEGGSSFEPQATFNAGLLPYGVAAGKFDADPRVDLAVANGGSNNVSILIQGAPDPRPNTTITSGPASGSVTNGDDPSFVLSGTPPENVAHFECKLDSAEFETCTSPRGYSDLGEGTHTFTARACHAVAGCDPTPASRTWTIDKTAPGTQIDSGPANASTTANNDPSFAFSGTPAADVHHFECSLDEADYANCTSPRAYTDLADGSRAFSVRACDAAGNCDGTPATRFWEVDTTPPGTAIEAGPVAGSETADDDAHFEFSGNPAGDVDRYECRIAPQAFAPCSSPLDLEDVAEGARTFEVHACDAVGNCDPTPASRSWTIDRTPPDTQIGAAPAASTNNDDPSFGFTGTPGDVARFECKLDGADFGDCTAPRVYADVAEGSHTFVVRACDAVGNCDASPASHAWTIDKTAPDTQIDSGPAQGSATNVDDPSFGFSGTSGDVARFECKLDGSAFATCSSPHSYADLASSPHAFSVRACDAAGNCDGSPASRSWTIDTIAPVTTISTGPRKRTKISGSSGNVTFVFASNDAGARFECKLDSGGFKACTAPKRYRVKLGSHSFQVRAIDAVGNVGASVTYPFRVIKR